MTPLAAILAHHGTRPALAIGRQAWSYAQVIDAARALAASIDGREAGPHSLVAVLAHKSPTATIAPLAAVLAGRGYLPLNVKFPARRLAAMIRAGGAATILVGPEAAALVAPLREALGEADPPTFIAVDPTATAGPAIPPRTCRPDAVAYLLFTSGSTGAPKGVPITFANLAAYLAEIRTVCPLDPDDRASQTFDPTFDLSVHDLFVTLSAGACLYPVPDASLINPARFIRQAELTAWFSVPSVAMFMARAGTLRPGMLPSLRLSLFCGEALPVATANQWAGAAPHSRLVNLYGPTEATIAIAAQDWNAAARRLPARNGVVPIGRLFPGQRHRLVADDGAVVAGPGRGELCLAGAQVCAGYLDDPAKTAERFLSTPDGRWYRTGDLVEQDSTGLLHFLGRVDFQVKINGYRVELGETEAALRRASGCDAVVALPTAVGAVGGGLIAYILGEAGDAEAILAVCRQTLPPYMVPSRLIWRRSFPLNANGKIDRLALAALGDETCRPT